MHWWDIFRGMKPCGLSARGRMAEMLPRSVSCGDACDVAAGALHGDEVEPFTPSRPFGTCW